MPGTVSSTVHKHIKDKASVLGASQHTSRYTIKIKGNENKEGEKGTTAHAESTLANDPLGVIRPPGDFEFKIWRRTRKHKTLFSKIR